MVSLCRPREEPQKLEKPLVSTNQRSGQGQCGNGAAAVCGKRTLAVLGQRTETKGSELFRG